MKTDHVNDFLIEIGNLLITTTGDTDCIVDLTQDITKWYTADKDYNDENYNDFIIPWPVIDLVKMNVMRYSENRAEEMITLNSVKKIISEFNKKKG